MSAKEEPARLAYINVTRGFAILLVILVHTAQSIPNLPSIAASLAKSGQFGVQLFFVASALTLCLTAKGIEFTPRKTSAFYARRFFRIWPMYTLGVATYLCVHIATQWRSWPEYAIEPYTLQNILINITLINGLVPGANNVIVPGGWSIGTEILFYLAFPPLYSWAINADSPNRSANRLTLLTTLILIAYALVLRAAEIPLKNNTFPYYFIALQFYVFAAGSALYLHLESSRPNHATANIAARYFLGTLPSIAFSSALLESAMPLTISAVAVSCFYGITTYRSKMEGMTRVASIGNRSFSIYVLHFLFAWHAVRFLYRHIPGLPEGTLGLAIFTPLVTLASYIAAGYTEKYIEQPFIRLGKQVSKRLQSAGEHA